LEIGPTGLRAPLPPSAFATKIPQATANAQPAVTTIHPLPLAKLFSNFVAAHTPQPNKIKIAVPKNSPKKAFVIVWLQQEKIQSISI
jgi:hypothetical protein